jgi:hypothetical protein
MWANITAYFLRPPSTRDLLQNPSFILHNILIGLNVQLSFVGTQRILTV